MREVYELSEYEYQDLVFKMVVYLHKRGLGLLKFACYTKEGLGAWRHLLFASRYFPPTNDHSNLPKPFLFGSFRDILLAKRINPETAGDYFISENVELAAACQGDDYPYISWFASVAKIQFGQVFEMEHPEIANLGALRIYTPYERGQNIRGAS